MPKKKKNKKKKTEQANDKYMKEIGKQAAKFHEQHPAADAMKGKPGFTKWKDSKESNGKDKAKSKEE